MYELKKMERYLRVNLLGPGPPYEKKKNYRAAVSQRLRNTALEPMNSVEVGQFSRLRHAACYLLRLTAVLFISTSFTKLPWRYTAFERQFDMKLHI